MSGDPLQPSIHEETLIGYALNRLLRGDTSTEAYYSLRRDEQFSHYSTQSISGAIRVAQRLRTTAADYMLQAPSLPLYRVDPDRINPDDIIGYRVVITYTDREGTPRGASVVMNARAGVPRSTILSEGEKYILLTMGDSDRQRLYAGDHSAPRVTSVLPGGYQGGVDFTEL